MGHHGWSTWAVEFETTFENRNIDVDRPGSPATDSDQPVVQSGRDGYRPRVPDLKIQQMSQCCQSGFVSRGSARVKQWLRR
jgi:hypothetical protein